MYQSLLVGERQRIGNGDQHLGRAGRREPFFVE